MQYLKLFIIFLLAICFATAADVYPVSVNSIELRLGYGSVKASLSDNGRIKSLRVSDGKDEIAVPQAELEDIDDPVLQGLRVTTTQQDGIKSFQHLKDGEYLIVSLEFSKKRDVFVKSENQVKIERVRNRVYYVFARGGYVHRSKRVALERDAVWTLYYKEPGKKEIQDGTEVMKLSDYPLAGPPSLPVRN